MTIPRFKISYSQENGPKILGSSILVKNVNLGYFFFDKLTNNGDWSDLSNWWLDPEATIPAEQLPSEFDKITIYSDISIINNLFDIPIVNEIILLDDKNIQIPIITNNIIATNFNTNNISYSNITVLSGIIENNCPSANYRGILAPDGNYYSGSRWKDGLVELSTDVGTNGGPSYYGTYDQTGNVWEITDTIHSNGLKICSGGSYRTPINQLYGFNSLFTFIGYDTKDNDIGFRILTIDDTYSYSGIMIESSNDFVDIQNINNSGDPFISSFDQWSDTYGSGNIDYNYKILKYPVTNYEYSVFLNAVDPDGLDQSSLRKHIYNELMNSSEDIYMGGIDFISTAPKGQKYKPAINMHNKPVVHVSWYNAARMCNWLHNGAPVFENSNSLSILAYDSGIYINNGGFTQDIITNTGDFNYVEPKYRLPQFNEWYKAGFYEESVSFTGFYPFAMRTFSDPVAVSASISGSGIIPEACLKTIDSELNTNNYDPCNLQNQFLNNIDYYYYGDGGDWYNIHNWWLDSDHTLQSPIFPHSNGNVYIQSSISQASGTVYQRENSIYDPLYGPQFKTVTIIEPINIRSLVASGCIVDINISCSEYAIFTHNAVFGGSGNFTLEDSSVWPINYLSTLDAKDTLFFENSINYGKLSSSFINFYGPYDPIFLPEPQPNTVRPYGYFFTRCLNGESLARHAPLVDIFGNPVIDKGSHNRGIIINAYAVNFYDTSINDGIIFPQYVDTALSLPAKYFSQELYKLLLTEFLYSRRFMLVAVPRVNEINFYGYSKNKDYGIVCRVGGKLQFSTNTENRGKIILSFCDVLFHESFINSGIIDILTNYVGAIKGTNANLIGMRPNTAAVLESLVNEGGISGSLLTAVVASGLQTIGQNSITTGRIIAKNSNLTQGEISVLFMQLLDSAVGGIGSTLESILNNGQVTVNLLGNCFLDISTFKPNPYLYDEGGNTLVWNFQTNMFDSYPINEVQTGNWPNPCFSWNGFLCLNPRLMLTCDNPKTPPQEPDNNGFMFLVFSNKCPGCPP